MNIKRAFKTMDKEGGHFNLYERLSNGLVLVTNGHMVVTVSSADFEANKEFLARLDEVKDNRISKLAFENNDMEPVRLTTVSIKCGQKDTRVMKSGHGICVVNEKYLKVLEDVGYDFSRMMVKVSTTGKIKTPLMSSYVENDKVYCLYAVLPINCDVKGTLEYVLN